MTRSEVAISCAAFAAVAYALTVGTELTWWTCVLACITLVAISYVLAVGILNLLDKGPRC